ncbi:unnamed protein product [Callosobruchus maculatus]|uniref:Serine hydrolase domain-containing protein n=1 Tax=Callosobruchus maculatus TaxID=64391 RepID=A0A653BKN2_CALMS|nr:unnamed protein product [Callosobruchus maculatus]
MDYNPQIEQKCCSEDSMSQKLKVLAIHGYRQNGEKFREKTGKFRKTVRKWAQFTFITAPHKVIPVDDSNDLNKSQEPDIEQSQDEELYAWFFNRDDNTYRGIRDGGPAIGFEESVKLIEQIFTEEGPFDGLVGFSQGACFVGLLCAMQQRGCMLNYITELLVPFLCLSIIIRDIIYSSYTAKYLFTAIILILITTTTLTFSKSPNKYCNMSKFCYPDILCSYI